MICEFVPSNGRTKKAIQNEVDFQVFMKQLTSCELPKGQVAGPIMMPGGGLVPADMPLCVGKIEINI